MNKIDYGQDALIWEGEFRESSMPGEMAGILSPDCFAALVTGASRVVREPTEPFLPGDRLVVIVRRAEPSPSHEPGYERQAL